MLFNDEIPSKKEKGTEKERKIGKKKDDE